ncbi:MAG TPA: hypothetical protein PL131_12135 [Methylotenera sp.]|nr:hypothetical protein [Methylotenera sp.]HPH06612.1 hypothetical protein [Methylotenera sp.]HPN01856.1 hypothetical protein [Methylotenera sp.]
MFKVSQQKIILCATANQLLAGLWRAGELQGSQTFGHHEEGQLAFAEFLQKHENTPVYLVADAVEEDYKLESLPHTAGNAKRELIERKLNQFYRGLVYRTAHFIKRDTEKRKDDQYLFVALTKDEFIKTWVAIIQAAKAPLVGVYLLPMLSQVLVRQLKLMAPHILLCEKLSSGLRQTYLHNGRLRMSRLVPNVPLDDNQLSYFYLVETEKTRLYLMSQRFIAQETPLELVLLSVDGSTQTISQSISQEQNIQCDDVVLSEIAKNLGLSTQLVQQTPELLHMQLLAKGHIVDNLAPSSQTKEYQANKIKQVIKISTFALGAVGVTLAGLIFKQGLDYKESYRQALQDTVIQQHRYDEAAKNFPNTPIGAGDLQLAVELDKTINSFPKSPRRVMQVVSTALEQSPEIQLDRLRWALSSDVNMKDEDKLLPVVNAQTTDVANSTLSMDTNTLRELGFINAEISNFTGDYRAALNSVNKFVSNLKMDRYVESVEVIQAPVNVSSYVGLQGSTTDEQSTQRQPAVFKLKVILKPSEFVEKDVATNESAAP